ncbi:hypothetical protein A2Y85_02745 [candidate division WOR-3 bacterium RBG_13_43_14]|uniref:DUF559 domain-containing protein n=1 Tax=candidate division WOR-3 bacterium RBG_13_43_14 TaxID=1802590 RepID=A0A1F4U1P1_UNCW3|nr:MAG: hypothetical protein A2Y85_02745 [candidate division WOR-3 bacterium RBG_13_43_14]
MISYNLKLKVLSRNLRKKMTYAERTLWSKLRLKQLKGRQFYRQKPIGNYIVDFYCPKAQLVIELDGGQHYLEKGKLKDNQRDLYLNKLGLKVLRFSDRDIFINIDAVLKRIYDNL